MCETRAQFKLALRKCKILKGKKSADLLALKLLHNDDKEFWKIIRKINNRKSPTVSTMEGANVPKDILKMWRNHYQSLLNSSSDISLKSVVTNSLDHGHYNFDRFTIDETTTMLRLLKCGKSSGRYNVYAEHFKFAHESINVYLSFLLNAIMVHGYLPPIIMDTVIVPVIKDKKGNVTSKDNYRPIAITSVFRKVL